jgi:hypothetical protein
VQMLQWVPGAVAELFPREACVVLAALESLADHHNHQGTEKERTRRAALREQVRTQLGGATFGRAWSEGSALSLAETVDQLRWMVDATP